MLALQQTAPILTMSFQNPWQDPQSNTLEGMNWLPQTNVMSSENYLPCEIDDILQWLPADQNPQLLSDPTYDSVHMSTLGWPQEDNLLGWPQDDNLLGWPQEDNLLGYSAMLLDDLLQTQTTATYQNAPAGSANEMQPISGEQHSVTEPATEAQHTEEHSGSDSQGPALASRLERLEERVGLIEEETK